MLEAFLKKGNNQNSNVHGSFNETATLKYGLFVDWPIQT